VDQAAEVAELAAAAPIVAAEMAGTTAIPAVHLRLDQARWVATSAASATKRGTLRVIAGPSQRRRRTLRKKKNP
jgi:hypothetical protein